MNKSKHPLIQIMSKFSLKTILHSAITTKYLSDFTGKKPYIYYIKLSYLNVFKYSDRETAKQIN